MPTWRRLLAGLTVEHAAYAVLIGAAFVLRLVALGRTPFAPAEAAQSVAALDWLADRYTLLPSGTSPLLAVAQWLIFLLAGANETLARLLPALAGSVTVALVYTLRAELGRVAALGSAALLALSSVLVFISRQATGDSLALLAGMSLLAASAAQRRGQPRAPFAIAAAAALLLLSSPLAYSVLLCLLPLLVLLLWPDDVIRSNVPTARRTAVILFLGILLTGGTGLFFLPGGLAAVAELPAAWLHGFVHPTAEALPAALLKLLWFEPLLLIAGLIGLVSAVRRRMSLAQGLALSLALAVLLFVVRAGRTPGDLAVLSWLLALLGGQALAALLHQLRRLPLRGEGLALWLASLLILASSAAWLSQSTEAWKTAPPMPFLASTAATVVVLVSLIAIYAVMLGREAIVPVIWAVVFSTLLLLGLRGTVLTSLNHDPLRWGSHANLTGASDGPELRRALQRVAEQRGSDLRDLPVAFIAAPGSEVSPLLRWYGRGTRPQDLAVENPETVLLAMADPAPVLPPQAQNYGGMSFRLAQQWSPAALRGVAWLRWLCYDEYGVAQQQQRAVLFVGENKSQ
ncbi:MAG: glycosyltransferase family 39 protein [Caldilineales bacterium]